MAFPKDFVWGAAAASYQIEGAVYEDGKGLSIWDIMCRQPGKIWMGNTGDTACDHYHRFKDDVKLMAEIGIKAYRFSISWPRVLPDGKGRVNEKGLDFYDKLVDALLEKGIQPWATLFHWDYPYELFCRGGWLNRDTADWFAEYTAKVVDKLSDRVVHWMTLNEPGVFIGMGHMTGEHAPCLKLDILEILCTVHHVLLSHGRAVQAIRAHAKEKPVVGFAVNEMVYSPASDSNADIESARHAMFSISKNDYHKNIWFSEPMVLGRYPEEGMRLFGKMVAVIKEDDMDIIAQPLDFYGVNIYSGKTVRSKDGGYDIVPQNENPCLTTYEWPVTPTALYWGPRFLYERYKLPIVITENGMSNCDWVHLDGKVHDPQRIDFLKRYLREYRRAMDDGIPCKGYFLWSIMDNFEWAQGYKQRFGIIHIDYQTQKRTLKDSAYWYKDVIASNGAGI